MFVLPPQSPFLPTSSRDELLKFGDPLQLQCGVKLKEKSNAAKNKTIHNLYELDVNVKYITEQGHVIQRVSETQIVVKKKSTLSSPKNIHNNITNATIPSSNPINIPTTFSAPKTPSMIIPYPKSNPRSVRLGNSSDSSDNLSSIGSYASSFEDGVEFINKSPSMFAHEIKDSFTLTVQIQPTCPGERLEWLVKNVTYFTDNKSFEGSLYITNFQLMFLSSEFRCDNKYNSNMPIWMHTQRPEIEISVPLAAISKFEKVDKQNSHFMFGVGGENCYALDIYTKDFRKTLRFILNPNDPFHSLKDICQRLSVLIFPTDYRKVFAFSCNQPPTVHFESLMGTLESEFKRLGADIPNSGWKFTELNKDYSLCKSYPKTLVVPADMQDDELREVSNFRGKGRIPVLSWRNKATGVSITRTSQPKTGISRSFRCKADERIVELIRKTNMNKDKKLWILDARPMANAFANMALGGGYENMTFYQDSEFKWLGVANIHVVRDSWDKLRTVCETNTKLTCDDNSSNSSWLSQLESTRWLDHVSLILSSTINMVQILDERKESVFIHCSDGWDRTPQLVCLAQIMLDKYYRTIKGFCVLIQKEWISFGHKFGERLGLNFVDNTFKDTERSPVFLQFLDAVFQIMQQFPSAFEFTDDLLLTIMEHAYSGKFGTFLFNYESQREEARVNEETPSLWVYILNNTTQYINPFYIAHGEPSVLYPSTSVQKLKFWNRYFLQYLDPQVLSKDQTVQIGRQMRTTIQNLESKVISLEREKEELIKKIKELQGRERALSNGIPVEDQHHHKMELQPSPPKPMSESDSPSKTPDGNDILNEEDFYAIT